MMKTVLMVAEKPSLAQRIANILSRGKYNNWDKEDPAELFSIAPTEKKEVNPKLNMVKFLQVEGRNCDYVVLWLDCICFEVSDKYFQGKYGNLDSSLISFGPCQTPALGFCVERHDKIQSFKSETYWVLQVKGWAAMSAHILPASTR